MKIRSAYLRLHMLGPKLAAGVFGVDRVEGHHLSECLHLHLLPKLIVGVPIEEGALVSWVRMDITVED